jgi:two-component system, OmpR family, sensor histidine kinase CpxA
MRFIYLKIFVWFWIAMIAVGVTLGFVVAKTEDQSLGRPWRQELAALLPLQAERIVEVYEQRGPQAFRQYEKKGTGAFRIQIHLLDDQGKDLGEQPSSPEIRELARRASQSGKVEFADDRIVHEAAVQVDGPDGRRYVYALAISPTLPVPPLLNARPRTQIIRIFAVVGAGGFVCFWLARYISSPVSELRAATRALAGGNLRARIAPGVCRRSDELGDLGIDFNAMAERMQCLLESQRRLLRDISHELRSPLARLRVALDLAKEGAAPSSLRAHGRIELEAEKINDMIGSLLRLSRLEAIADLPDKSQIDLARLVHQAADEAALEAVQNGRSVKVLQSESCTIMGNEELLHSVLENLIRNAMRYTPEGTAVEMDLSKQFSAGAWHAVLSVRDYGPGVPPAHLTDIFEAFFRVEDSRNRATGGTGLGLSIAQRAVHLHGGTIRATNMGRGGLKIEVRLPLGKVQEYDFTSLGPSQQIHTS